MSNPTMSDNLCNNVEYTMYNNTLGENAETIISTTKSISNIGHGHDNAHYLLLYKLP